MTRTALLCFFWFSFVKLFLTKFIEKYFLYEKSPRKGAFHIRLFCFSGLYANASAENFRIGIRGFAQKTLIVGANGEEGRIHARKLPRVFEDFVPAEVYDHVHLLVEIICYLFLNGCNVVFLLYHNLMIDKANGIYTC